MNDLFLGIIAASVLVMALIQVGVIVAAFMTARRVGQAVARLEQDLRPIVDNLHAVSADVARVTAAAAAQVERAEQTFDDLSQRVGDTLASVQHAVVAPARDLRAMLQGIKAAFDAFRGGMPPRPPAAAEDEDPLFIG